MRELLLKVIFISIFIWCSSGIYAQSSRVKEVSKTNVINDLATAKTYPNIEEKKTERGRFNKENNTYSRPDSYEKTTPPNGASNRDEARKTRNTNTTSENTVTGTTFPDFKVNAIQEQPYENNIELKEKRPEQLVSIQPVMRGKEATENANTNNPNDFTISPLKRKYFETIVSGLEKEIQADPNSTSPDMLAKKKELEDLKKLLAH